ncbi:N-acetyltransferase eso1 [Cryptotrichosporon argae]
MAYLSRPSRREVIGNPPTYRHLLSPQAMTVFNPLRTIAHCDIDAAYAQFEQVRLGLPDDVPLICAQWQSIIAVNYPARKYGIKRFNTIEEAKRMCPHLFVQHVATYREGEDEAGYWDEVDPKTHKASRRPAAVSLDPYRRESLKILAIFKQMAPKGEIEKASIDEAFLDLTPMVLDRLLAIHPYLASVPADATDGLDTYLPDAPPISWDGAGNVVPADARAEPDHADNERDDGSVHEDDGEAHWRDTWEDWALAEGARIMQILRHEVYKRLHYTCSAGIAHNKAMAKLCSAWKKPNDQTVLRASATAAFLRTMDFQEIRFLGGKLGNAIAQEYGAKTVGDMLTVPLEEMQAKFGEESIWVYNILRGIDYSEVKEKISTKSMLASKNVRPAVTTPAQGHHWLAVLSGELAVRLREARERSPGLWPKTLVLSVRQPGEASRSRQAAFPYTRALGADHVAKHARRLWDDMTAPLARGGMVLNNIALAFTGLEQLEGGQQGIESFFGNGSKHARTPSPPPPRPVRLVTPEPPTATTPPDVAALPAPARSSSTASASSAGPSPKKPRLPTLHTGKARPRSGLNAFLAPPESEARPAPGRVNAAASSSRPLGAAATHRAMAGGGRADRVKADGGMAEGAEADGGGTAEQPAGTWTCPKCAHTFGIEPDAAGRARSVDEQRQEHDDWHFALELDGGGVVAGTDARTGAGTGTGAGTQASKRRDAGGGRPAKKKKGIEAFFTKAKPR